MAIDGSPHPRRGRWLRQAARVAVGLALLGMASGCAARGSRFAERFVRPGEPSLNLAAKGTVPPEDTLRDFARRVRTVQANARPKSTLGSTIEGQNPVLAAALLKLSMHESAANHREVAAGRKGTAFALDHQHLDGVVGLDLGAELFELLRYGEVHRIEGLGPVQRDGGDRPVDR